MAGTCLFRRRLWSSWLYVVLGTVVLSVGLHAIPSLWKNSWEAEHGGSIEKRPAAHKAIFYAVGSKQGAAHGWIGAAQFTEWLINHIEHL